MAAVEIPDELLQQANRIPGLGKRVARFIRLEVAQYEMRQKRFHPETLALVARAQAHAEEKRAAGFDPKTEEESFLRHLDHLTTPKTP